MAQHDYDIANADGATVRADINSALEAIETQNSGTSAPSVTFAFMPWFDTSNNLFKRRNAANNAWVTIASLVGNVWVPYNNGSALPEPGTDVGDVVQLVGVGSPAVAGLPAVDGSQLTGINAGASAASQAEMEAASSTTVYASPGRVKFHPGVAKAWAKWNAAGTLAGSLNVSSITDNGTGDWTVNFTTAFADTNYAAIPAIEPPTTGSHNAGINLYKGGIAVGSVRIQGSNLGGGVALDGDSMHVVCFGDQ